MPGPDGRPWSWEASIPPETPRALKTVNPDTPDAPSPGVKPVTPATSSTQLRIEFVRWATKEIDEDEKDTFATNFQLVFNQLDPDQQRVVVAQIRKVVEKEDEVEALAQEVNGSLAMESARPIWANLARKTAVLATMLAKLDKLWTYYPKSDSTFDLIIQQRVAHVNKLNRDASVMNSRDPSSAAGGAALFEAGLAALNLQSAEQPRALASGVDWERFKELEAIRRSNAKATGMTWEWLQSPDSTWKVIEQMSGGMGKIDVWAKDDGNGRIVDRVVLKDTQMSFTSWQSESSWYGNGEDNVPIEFWVHSKMSNGGKYVLQLASRRVQVDEDSRKFRMWMEYCPNGDLYQLLERHWKAGVRVPVEFILYVFKAMVDACLVMKQGSMAPFKDSWEQIVHRDLKPDNVFLGLPRSTFANYPEPKLADFGLAIVTSPSDATNPELYNLGAGTKGYLPPEQLRFINPSTGAAVDDFKLLSPCNVWGIGAIILDLLDCSWRNSWTQPDYMPGGRWEYFVLPATKIKYSGVDPAWGTDSEPHNDLFDIVDKCLSYRPEDRPTPEQLRKWLSKKMAPMTLTTWPPGSTAPGGQADDPKRMIVPREHAHYLGMALQDVARPVSAVAGAPPFPLPSTSADGGGGAGGVGGAGGAGGLKIMNAAPGDFSSSAEAFLAGS
ncbi:Putative serine/threonine-protein kinase, active [Septoria linicola]|uniref:Serine/threonine-protein kinase, active n=1 Tax=Septoria linicola TaxID=215465 RepID=A0A9Q9AN69_9PEZI|nr:putative serine/threonine-protein kinase, active [Septoria linicola]USW49041.1 Putative serine/threonine-protein kinase, active [Septoria linicola]